MTVVIGTAGHIDHGKTTLLRALTGIDADRLPEERRRGMTIDVGYAHLTLPDGTELDFVDVPGHDRLVGNMLVGAGEIDAAMLVVAADDGPRAQTIEHLALLDALGIRHGRRGRDQGGRGRAGADGRGGRRGRAAARGTTLAGSPVLAVSSVDGDGVEALRAALVGPPAIAVLGIRRPDVGPRTAPASRSTASSRSRAAAPSSPGRSVAGRSVRGATLRLVPGDRSVRVREIQVHGATVDEAEPGRTALNLAGVEAGDLHRGLVLTDDPAVVASDRILVALRAACPTARGSACIRDRGRRREHRPERSRRPRPSRRVPSRRSGWPPRSRSRRAIGWSSGDLRRGPDRRGPRARRRAAAGSRAGGRPSSAWRGSRPRSRTGDRAAIAAARLDLHGALEPMTGPVADRPGRAYGRRHRGGRGVDGPCALTAARTVAAGGSAAA